jgi:hypothetical protein
MTYMPLNHQTSSRLSLAPTNHSPINIQRIFQSFVPTDKFKPFIQKFQHRIRRLVGRASPGPGGDMVQLVPSAHILAREEVCAAEDLIQRLEICKAGN